jgi:hypothetical protein
MIKKIIFSQKKKLMLFRCYEISPKILAYQILLSFAFLNLIGKTSDLAHYSRKWEFCSNFCLSNLDLMAFPKNLLQVFSNKTEG